jgi:CTP synthase
LLIFLPPHKLGGTVGDIESMPFVEALTELRRRAGKDNFLQIHVSYVPTIHGEQKTKPTQMAVKAVRTYGLIPDIVMTQASHFAFSS